MEYNNESFISLRYTKDDFLDLRLCLNSDDNWDTAIEIFQDRIQGRYFNVIDELIQREELMRDGFIIMALNCLLIETLLQFKNGWDETEGGNKRSYSDFLVSEFPRIFNLSLAGKFYSDIRCGILHSAQTKGKSKLTFNEDYVVKLVKYQNKEYVKVDVKNFTTEIRNYYNRYLKMIENNKGDIRENFRKKMMYICLK
ncbi:hypothetical protein M5J14_05815 [Lysinibacillus sp. OL1_EC]|uniref:hypothetical protein n=1 Tax=unclassified Lysinibacillus TaxID=2636778 RepID=UPI001038AEA0|nr:MULTISPECIES: hypothetical protein [unclassified Lysinibacillus]MCM0624039.1 hypothetical protein [Lysinibacillus sp. OL1_EC]TBV88799.1 hypothetical protein EW028_05000 [Lysinibacillus sp. OL1]UKJ43499.1 hypothetical protein L6W14_12010 [Lysinibacillus sp. ACHW1.5]